MRAHLTRSIFYDMEDFHQIHCQYFTNVIVAQISLFKKQFAFIAIGRKLYDKKVFISIYKYKAA